MSGPKWRYIEPRDPVNNDWSPVEIVRTENEILAEYYPTWARNMARVNDARRESGQAEYQITPDSCIEDWVAVNWAERVSE